MKKELEWKKYLVDLQAINERFNNQEKIKLKQNESEVENENEYYIEISEKMLNLMTLEQLE